MKTLFLKVTRIFLIVLVLASALVNPGSATAQTSNLVADTLQPQFGTVMVRDLEGSHEFTLSAPFTEIETLLATVVKLGWYPSFISVSSRNDEKAAIILRADSTQNSSSEKFAALQQLLTPGMLPWKTGELTDKSPAVVSVETDFTDKLTILGQTLKSSLIFSQLFPMIERAQSVKDPFFERGSYNDSPAGRVMNFSVKCNW